jgi:hypothetical protein
VSTSAEAGTPAYAAWHRQPGRLWIKLGDYPSWSAAWHALTALGLGSDKTVVAAGVDPNRPPPGLVRRSSNERARSLTSERAER